MRDPGSTLAPAGLRVLLLLSPILWVLLAPAALSAQLVAGRISMEPRLAFAFPIGDFGNADPSCPTVQGGAPPCPYPIQTGAEPGWRWGIRVHYTLNRWLGAVGGYGRAHFGCPGAFCGAAKEPAAQGWELGLKGVVTPLGTMMGWVEGGGTYETVAIVRTQNPEGERESRRVDYEGAFGYSLGVGAEFPLRGAMDLTFVPGVRLRRYEAGPPASDSDLSNVKVTYVLFEAGFRYIFGRGG